VSWGIGARILLQTEQANTASGADDCKVYQGKEYTRGGKNYWGTGAVKEEAMLDTA